MSDVAFKFSKGVKKLSPHRVEKCDDDIWVNWKMMSSGEPHNRMMSLWRVTIFDIYGKLLKLKSKQPSWHYISIYTLIRETTGGADLHTLAVQRTRGRRSRTLVRRHFRKQRRDRHRGRLRALQVQVCTLDQCQGPYKWGLAFRIETKGKIS
jgi:hypothetical protein